MWYFAWILGIGFACAFAVLNAMWLEFDEVEDERAVKSEIGALDHPASS